MSAENQIPESLADRAAAPDRILAAFSRLLVVVDDGAERAEMPAVRRGSLLSHALSHIAGTLAGQVWGTSALATSAVVAVFERAVTSTEQQAADLAQRDREPAGPDVAFVIHDLDGTDSGACAPDCSGCAIESDVPEPAAAPVLHWPSSGLSTTTLCQGEPLTAADFAEIKADVTCPACLGLMTEEGRRR